MIKDFEIEIISPEKVLMSDKTFSVTIPSYEGDMTILPDHISLTTFLRPGVVIVSGKDQIKFFLEEGTVEFSKNKLSILSSTIIEISKLSKDNISKMINDTKELLNKKDLDDKKRYIASHKLDCLSKISL